MVKLRDRKTKEGIAVVATWIENSAEKTDCSHVEYEGPAYLIYPREVEAMKHGELPESKDRF